MTPTLEADPKFDAHKDSSDAWSVIDDNCAKIQLEVKP